MKFDVFVARRYLKARRKQAFIGVISIITLAGITVGIAALNIALSIHNGMRGAFVESLVGSTGNLYIVDNSVDPGFDREELEQIVDVLGQVPGVRAFSAMYQENGVVISPRRRLAYARLNGIVPADFTRTSDTLDRLQEGTLQDLENRPQGSYPGVILGADMAENLGLRTGDPVRIAVPRLSSPGLIRRDLKLKELRCVVVGVFRTGNSQFDDGYVYLLLEDLMRVLNTTQIQSVLVSFEKIQTMDRAKQKLASHPDLPLFATVVDLRDLNQGLLRALKLEKMATTLVIGLFIMIVALNMISALTMLVMEKHRDIGIMKSFGTPNRIILKIFIRQGMTLSLRGTVLGTVLGVAAALALDKTRLIKLDNNVYEVLNYLPFKIDPLEVVFVAIGSLLLSYLTCIFPARQAARLDPAEALRYD